MSRLKTHIIIVFTFMSVFVYGQNENYSKANKLLLGKQYAAAYNEFSLILTKNDNPNVNYKIGLSLFHLNKKQKALSYFAKGINHTTKKYNFKDSTEQKVPIDIYYYYANCQHATGNLLTAFLYYDKFYQKSKKKNPLRFLAETGMYQCRTAEDQSILPQTNLVKNLGDSINSNQNEYRPVISLDGTEIYFTSNRLRSDSTNFIYFNPYTGTHFEDIYLSYKTESGKWTDPTYLSFCEPNVNNSSLSTTIFDNRLFIYNDQSNNGDIFYTSFGDDQLTIDTIHIEGLNSEYKESHACQSNDGEYIYFSSDRPGGYGGLDIYKIRKLPNGNWSKPQNLGPTINSVYDEESPSIGADGITLYFSSNGAESIGGYDIFVSQLNEINEWSKPKNLGIPINTYGDDLYYSTMANGFMGIYASNYKNNSGDFDIFYSQSLTSYYRNVAIFKGRIQTTDNQKIPDGISIHVRDLTEDGKTITFKPRMRDGVYILNLFPCHSYSIDYRYKNETFYSTKKLVPCSSSYQEIQEELILDVVNLKVTNTREIK